MAKVVLWGDGPRAKDARVIEGKGGMGGDRGQGQEDGDRDLGDDQDLEDSVGQDLQDVIVLSPGRPGATIDVLDLDPDKNKNAKASVFAKLMLCFCSVERFVQIITFRYIFSANNLM